MPRRAAKVDANHTEIVRGLRATGCTVIDLSVVGKGCPDILVGKHMKNILMEIKDGNKPWYERKLTADQIKFEDTWRGLFVVVTSLDEALDAVGAMVLGR